MITPTRKLATILARGIPASRRTYIRTTQPIQDEEITKLNVCHQTSPLANSRERADKEELMERFKDPSSHYHIPPGTNGPSHEEDHSTSRTPFSSSSISSTSSTSASSSTTNSGSTQYLHKEGEEGDGYEESRLEAMKMFKAEGYDTEGILEWPVAWGDCDMFQ